MNTLKFSAICLFLTINIFASSFAETQKYFLSREFNEADTYIVAPTSTHSNLQEMQDISVDDAKSFTKTPAEGKESFDMKTADVDLWNGLIIDMIDIVQTLKKNNFYVDKLSIDKLFFLNSLSTIVYNGLVHKIVDGENKRSAFIELLKSIPVDVNNLADEYGVDAAIKEGLNKNTMAYSSLIYQLSDTDDIDFDKLMAIYRAPANTAENASGAATEAAPEAK